MDDESFLIVNNAEPGIEEFCIPLVDILQREGCTSRILEYRQAPSADFGGCRGVFLSGSPRGDDIVEHHQPYFQWIRSVRIPVLGICAGHHIIGRLFQARLIRDREKEVGDYTVTVEVGDPLFQGMENPLTVRQDHHDSITLPGGFVRLARSGRCRVQAMRHRHRPIYSTQFHPEVLNPQMIRNFVKITRRPVP